MTTLNAYTETTAHQRVKRVPAPLKKEIAIALAPAPDANNNGGFGTLNEDYLGVHPALGALISGMKLQEKHSEDEHMRLLPSEFIKKIAVVVHRSRNGMSQDEPVYNC